MIDIKDDLLKRLLTLSGQICIVEDDLADLSAKDLENTERFKDDIDKLNNLLNRETIILNTVSLEKLRSFQKILFSNDKYDDTAIAFNRLFQLIQDKLDEREQPITEQHEDVDDDTEEDTEYSEENEELEVSIEPKEMPIPEEIKDEIAILDDYYMGAYNLDKYLINVIDRISIIVIKKMKARISNTPDDTRIETKYKKQLLKYLKQFKYYVLTLDYKLERLGASHSFNVESIPNLPEMDKDLSPLYHNQCINILDTLYSSDISIRKPADITKLLYELMCLEEYITYLDKQSLNNLLSFCDYIARFTKGDNFGEYGKKRIKQRLGNS